MALPALDVSRRPIVEQAESEEMIGRARQRNGRAQAIGEGDERAQLELEIEQARGPELYFAGCKLVLAVWTGDRLTAEPHRAGTAVIRNRHIFERRRHGAIGTRKTSAALGVEDRGHEIGKGTKSDGKNHDRIALRDQEPAELLKARSVGIVAIKQVGDAVAQG